MKVGRRLAIKLLNASKFVAAPARAARARSPSRSIAACSPTSPRWSPTRPRALEDYDYAKALERTEAFFWDFCDNYLELVKSRRYGDSRRRGRRRRPTPRMLRGARRRCCGCSRRTCRSSTEEVWSWWRDGLGAPRGVADAGRGAAPARRRAGLGRAARATSAPQALSARCGGRRRRRRCRMKTRVIDAALGVPASGRPRCCAVERRLPGGALHIDALELDDGGTARSR